MKLITSIALILMASVVIAQHATPTLKDNTIYITSKLSGDSLFTEIGKRMAKSGFALTATNREFLQITGHKEMSGRPFDYELVILIDGNRAEIQPTVISEGVRTNRWYYVKLKTTINGRVHADILKTFAELGVLSYDKK